MALIVLLSLPSNHFGSDTKYRSRTRPESKEVITFSSDSAAIPPIRIDLKESKDQVMPGSRGDAHAITFFAVPDVAHLARAMMDMRICRTARFKTHNKVKLLLIHGLTFL